jgi:hypothetical protein
MSVQAQYDRSCPIISSSCYNGTDDTAISFVFPLCQGNVSTELFPSNGCLMSLVYTAVTWQWIDAYQNIIISSYVAICGIIPAEIYRHIL